MQELAQRLFISTEVHEVAHPPLTVPAKSLLFSVAPPQLGDVFVQFVQHAPSTGEELIQVVRVPLDKIELVSPGSPIWFVEAVKPQIEDISQEYTFTGSTNSTVSLKNVDNDTITVNVADLLRHAIAVPDVSEHPNPSLGTPSTPDVSDNPNPSPGTAPAFKCQCTLEALSLFAVVMKKTFDKEDCSDALEAIRQLTDHDGCAQGKNDIDIQAVVTAIQEFAAQYQGGSHKHYDLVAQSLFEKFVAVATNMQQQVLHKETVKAFDHLMPYGMGVTFSLSAEPQCNYYKMPLVDGKPDHNAKEKVSKAADAGCNPMKPEFNGQQFHFVVNHGGKRHMTIVLAVQTPKASEDFRRKEGTVWQHYCGEVQCEIVTAGHYAPGPSGCSWTDPKSTNQYVGAILNNRSSQWGVKNYDVLVTNIIKSQGGALATLTKEAEYKGPDEKLNGKKERAQELLHNNPELVEALTRLSESKYSFVFQTADGTSPSIDGKSAPSPCTSDTSDADISEACKALPVAIVTDPRGFVKYVHEHHPKEFVHLIENKPQMPYFEEGHGKTLICNFKAYASTEFNTVKNSTIFTTLPDEQKAYFMQNASRVPAKMKERQEEVEQQVQKITTKQLSDKVNTVLDMFKDKKTAEGKPMPKPEKLRLSCETLATYHKQQKEVAERLRARYTYLLESLQECAIDLKQFKDLVCKAYYQEDKIREQFINSDPHVQALLKTKEDKKAAAAYVVKELQADAKAAAEKAAEEAAADKAAEEAAADKAADKAAAEKAAAEAAAAKAREEEAAAAKAAAAKAREAEAAAAKAAAAKAREAESAQSDDKPDETLTPLKQAEMIVQQLTDQIARKNDLKEQLVQKEDYAQCATLKVEIESLNEQLTAAISAVEAAKHAAATKDDRKERDGQEPNPERLSLEQQNAELTSRLQQAESENNSLKRKLGEVEAELTKEKRLRVKSIDDFRDYQEASQTQVLRILNATLMGFDTKFFARDGVVPETVSVPLIKEVKTITKKACKHLGVNEPDSKRPCQLDGKSDVSEPDSKRPRPLDGKSDVSEPNPKRTCRGDKTDDE